jgi:pimeloyl-ACP methyl ester carboxylesterase
MQDHFPRSVSPSRWVTCGATRYHYRVAGADDAPGTPLVLVHGLGVSSAYWRRIQPLLADRRRVYALDLPGFGRTTRPHSPLDIGALARALGDWLGALDLAPIHLLGHSMGGQVVAAFARDHPDRVSGLILVGSTIGARGARAPHQTLGLLRDAMRESPSLLPVVLRDYFRAGTRRILRTDLLADDDDTVATVAQLAVAPLVIRGCNDTVVSLCDTRRVLQAVPAAPYIEVAGAAHAVHWSRPRAVADAVVAFLAAQDAGMAPADQSP